MLKIYVQTTILYFIFSKLVLRALFSDLKIQILSLYVFLIWYLFDSSFFSSLWNKWNRSFSLKSKLYRSNKIYNNKIYKFSILRIFPNFIVKAKKNLLVIRLFRSIYSKVFNSSVIFFVKIFGFSKFVSIL